MWLCCLSKESYALTSESDENKVQIELDIIDSLFISVNYNAALLQIESFERNGTIPELAKRDWLYRKIEIQYSLTNYIESIKLAKQYFEVNTLSKTKDQSGNVYLLLGNSFLFLDEFSIALDYYLKASEEFKIINRAELQLVAEGNIGLVYQEIKNYEEAIKRYKESLSIQKSIGVESISNELNNLARNYIYIYESNPLPIYLDSAQMYLDSAIKTSKRLKIKGEEAYSYRNLGWLFYNKGNYRLAEEYYLKALKINQEINNYGNIVQNAITLSRLYQKEGKYRKSLDISLKHIGLAENLKNHPATITLSDRIYDAYVALNEYKSAIDIQTKYKPIRDTLQQHKINNTALMAQLRSEAANEVSLLKQQEEINTQTIRYQNILLILAVFGIVLVILVAVIIYRSLIINKRLSALNIKQAERLEQLDAAKSRFFANISHDLRTPLSLIMGSIEQVLNSKDISLTVKAERQLKVGLQNGQRIIHLTNEINELIKLEDSKLQISQVFINLDHMVSLFVSMFNSMAEMKGVKLSYAKKLFDAEPIVSIDIHQFEKVLFNLITNALKHTRREDTVTVSLEVIEQTVQLFIIDTGEGIPEENVPYIFERYYQAPNTTYKTQEGFGIGLALVKEIIDKHDAKIEVKSKTDVGTQFIIKLPLFDKIPESKVSKLHSLDYSHDTRELFRDIEEVDIGDKPVVFAPKKSNNGEEIKHTILLVEDHPEVRQYIQDIIDPYYNVITADNGKRALKVLDSKEIDLITTDLMMPWFDGFELLEKLREDDKLSKIPVLVLSARTSEEDKSRVLSQGINDFLHKPFQANELLARIKNLLDRKNRWNSKNEDALFINNVETLNDIEKSLLLKVDNMILARIDDPHLAVPYLASEIAVSERKFFRMIKKLTGTTPYEYIKEFRLQYANKLLLDKKISTSSEAAKHIGMNNVSNFNTQFKSRFGKKPADILK